MITENQFNILLFKNLVVCNECIAHGCPELIAGNKLTEVISGLKLGVLVVSLNHFLSFNKKAGIQRDIRGQERLLIFVVHF